MDFKKRFNPIDKFDFSALKDPEFREDAVREEIISPIIHALGYKETGDFRIIRSRKLKHPFTMVGSKKHPVKIVPDYLLEAHAKPCVVVEAKSPGEPIINSYHTEQAYSYAVHFDVRAQYFVLCNGDEFVIYNTSAPKPLIQCATADIPFHWDQICSLIGSNSVEQIFTPTISKDFGLHILRLGMTTDDPFTLLEVPIHFVAKLSNELATFNAVVRIDNEKYAASFDFHIDKSIDYSNFFTQSVSDILVKDTIGIQQMNFSDFIPIISFICRPGTKMEENESEIFCPIQVDRFIRYIKI